MPVFRWQETWQPLHDLERQVDRLLESIPFPFPALRFERHYPPVNIYELDSEYLLTTEIPGTLPEDLELSINGGVLTLGGRRTPPAGVADEQYRRHERVWGQWKRVFNLPEKIDEERVAAEYIDGVLRIHLPKSLDARPRQIHVAHDGNGQKN